MATLDLILRILAGLTGLAGVWIGWSVFRLSQQQRRDFWSRSFSELHQAFWSDADFRQVREWIANDAAYSKLDDILRKRLDARSTVTKMEYEALEQLDKFFNFLLRAFDVANRTPRRGNKKNLWKRLFFQYWVDDIALKNRHRMWLYFRDYYLPHGAHLPFTVKEHIFNQFKNEAEGIRLQNKQQHDSRIVRAGVT